MKSDPHVDGSTIPLNEPKHFRDIGLHVIAARTDPVSLRLILELYSGARFEIPTELIEGLQKASSLELSEIVISPSGLGLHFPLIDADVSVLGLLRGVVGSPSWMSGHQSRLAQLLIAKSKLKAER